MSKTWSIILALSFWKNEGAEAKIVVYYPGRVKSCEKSPLPIARMRIQRSLVSFGFWTRTRLTAARLSSVSLADFVARKDLADFLLEALLDFLAVGFAYSVCNILPYLYITNLPINISKCSVQDSAQGEVWPRRSPVYQCATTVSLFFSSYCFFIDLLRNVYVVIKYRKTKDIAEVVNKWCAL